MHFLWRAKKTRETNPMQYNTSHLKCAVNSRDHQLDDNTVCVKLDRSVGLLAWRFFDDLLRENPIQNQLDQFTN